MRHHRVYIQDILLLKATQLHCKTVQGSNI